MERDPLNLELERLRKMEKRVHELAGMIEDAVKSSAPTEMKFYYIGVNLALLHQALGSEH